MAHIYEPYINMSHIYVWLIHLDVLYVCDVIIKINVRYVIINRFLRYIQ